MSSSISRKKFIASSVLAAISLQSVLKAFASQPVVNNITNEPLPAIAMKICIFSKCMHWLNYEDMAAMAAEIGFDGIDLTVRPGGHVLPERVTQDLPKAVAAIEKAGLKVYMITTNIKSADETYTADILKTAAGLGIKYYRTAWYDYDQSIDIPTNLELIKKRLAGLLALNKQYNMHGAYQNHAGQYFGASIWDLWLALKDLDPAYISCQYDIRHATVEGPDTWSTSLNVLHKHIKTIAIKDFTWAPQGAKWQARTVPLGGGIVNYDKYLSMIKQYQISGPASMHFEYALGGAEDGAKTITIQAAVFKAAIKKDLDTFKEMLKTRGM